MQTYNLAGSLDSGIRCTRFNITYSDLTTAGTTQNIKILLLPYASVVMGIRVKHDVAFTGGGLTAMTVQVASATPNNLTAAFNIFQAVANGTLQTTDLFFADQYTANQLTANFTSTSANVNAATAGSVSIDVWYYDITTANLTTLGNQPQLYPA